MFIAALASAAAAAGGAKVPKIPKDAPVCAAPDAKQIFLAPSGEPFRAAQGAPYPVADWFARADADHDGRLTIGEFVGDADRFFTTIDTDRDGEIVPDELARYEREVAPEIALWQQRPERPAGKRGRGEPWSYGGAMGAGRYALLNIPNPVASADADLDRGISRAEYRAAAARWFAALAKGADQLTLAALPATPAQAQALLPCRPRGPERR